MFSFLPVCAQTKVSKVDFFGEAIELHSAFKPPSYTDSLSEKSVQRFLSAIEADSLQPFLSPLLQYKNTHLPDDWLYYQLVRKVAQLISPKGENYYRYTFYKWWLLFQSGYDVKLAISNHYLLFYVQSDENIYNIPYHMADGKQYVCLNYHDYGTIDFEKNRFSDVTPIIVANAKAFSYKVQRLPEFKQTDYAEKEVQFSDGMREYSFRIKVNPQVKIIFNNYPVVGYDLQFNVPLSRTTYESLIPSLKKYLKNWSQRDGVDFLMRFTRYAFLFKPDTEAFGTEKRMSPEQTLLSEYSDCDDRSALFFCLVKEIYDLPMLALESDNHVTIAVQLDKPVGNTFQYNGRQYSICEPTPQRIDLNIGQTLPELNPSNFQVSYAYHPPRR